MVTLWKILIRLARVNFEIQEFTSDLKLFKNRVATVYNLAMKLATLP